MTGPQQKQYELTDEDREWVAEVVARLGPLTDEDREFLGMILRRPSGATQKSGATPAR